MPRRPWRRALEFTRKSSRSGHAYAHVLVGLHDLLDAGERQLVVLEEVHILGHLVDLPLDLLELGLQGLEVALEVQDLLRPLLLLVLRTALPLLEHKLLIIARSPIRLIIGASASFIRDCIIQMEERGEGLSEDYFAGSKLFSEALSQQSSHYIQAKLLALPKEAQELKKLDLRHMCETVVKELEVVEREAAYDYVKVSEELESLGSELTVADGIMEELEKVLYGFKDHLQAIKSEMTSLQEKSNKMNTSLGNKKKVQGLLASFIDSAVLDRELIDAICLAEIDDNYVTHIRLLLKKLNYLNSNLITPDSKAVRELQPELEKLKARASVRLREFLLEQISLLKKPKTNIQIVQKSVLGKYRVFTEFFKEQSPQVYTELCNSYREVMAKIYVGNYKAYLSEVEKLQVELYAKTDQLLPADPAHLRSFLPQSKPTCFNQERRSIFHLMGRDRIVEQHEASDVILYNVASQKGQKFTLEQTFKSLNKTLIDGVLHEVLFTADFFNVRAEGAAELFGPLFRPSVQLFLEQLRKAVAGTFDIYAVLLMLAVNERNRRALAEQGCPALESYFSQVGMVLWPKFEELFDFHLRALQACTLPHFRRLEKTAGSRALTDRFVDLVAGLYRLYVHFPSSMVMLEKRLQALRRGFLELAGKARGEFEREGEGLSYYLGILEQLHSSCTSDPVVAAFKEFHVYQQELEKEIGQFADKLVVVYVREFFPGLDGFIRKYCKEEGLAEEGALLIQGVVDGKALEATLGEVAPGSIGGRLARLLDFCEKAHSGYSLKALVRKFASTFTRYYGEIYKFAKASHPDAASTMLQTHSMIKELKATFTKYNP